MSRLENARKEYESTPIPMELDSRLRAGMAAGKRQRGRRMFGRTAGAAAACLVVVFAGLNISPSFAAAAADAPVVGGLFRLMTVRSYETAGEDYNVSVDQPGLTGDSALAEKVNREIAQRVADKTAEGERLVKEYKEAFFATGGTQAEWDEHDIQVTVTYDVKSQTDTTVSFVLHSDVSFADAYTEDTYYNLDIAADRELTLADVLGDDWAARCNAAVQTEMEQEPDAFFPPEEGGFTTVDETTAFYLDENGKAVVVFPAYTIAPGYLGEIQIPVE